MEYPKVQVNEYVDPDMRIDEYGLFLQIHSSAHQGDPAH